MEVNRRYSRIFARFEGLPVSLVTREGLHKHTKRLRWLPFEFILNRTNKVLRLSLSPGHVHETPSFNGSSIITILNRKTQLMPHWTFPHLSSSVGIIRALSYLRPLSQARDAYINFFKPDYIREHPPLNMYIYKYM